MKEVGVRLVSYAVSDSNVLPTRRGGGEKSFVSVKMSQAVRGLQLTELSRALARI